MSSRVIAGRYELLEKIGDGGMAVVYKAKCRLLNRFVAVKILKPEFTKDIKFIESFRKESHAAASLSHPNIVNVYDVGREGNINYIVMELVDGKTLSQVIKEEAPLDYKRAIDITKQIASALSVAHKNNIIHRDVKPHNILITKDGIAKITDFGIAKAVNTATLVEKTSETVMGSVHYFSPEQARGGYVDEKSDIYSLGIVLYEMLTGSVPFDADNAVSVALMHINNEITPPSQLVNGIPPRLEKIVLKATNKYQTNRFKSADEMIRELDDIEFVTRIVGTPAMTDEEDILQQGESETAESPNKKKSKFTKKEKIIATVAIVGALLIGFLAFAFGTGLFGGGEVKVPDLRGMTYQEAEEALSEVDLEIEEGDLVYSSDYKVDEIVSQDPKPNTKVKKGSTITVNLCRGGEEGTVPNLVGKSRTEAEDLIEKYGFKVGDVTTEKSDKPKDTVISQDPGAGDETTPGAYISFVVSDGTGVGEATVPYLVGKDVDEAKDAISQAGFKVGNISYESSDNYDKNQVMWQQYEPNDTLEKGTSISIKVSTGPEASKSVSLSIDYSKAKQEVFYLTVTLSDDNGTRNIISNEQRAKSDEGETVTLEGKGKGKVTVIFDDKVVMKKNVDFTSGEIS